VLITWFVTGRFTKNTTRRAMHDDANPKIINGNPYIPRTYKLSTLNGKGKVAFNIQEGINL
jgi:hypothetical protein